MTRRMLPLAGILLGLVGIISAAAHVWKPVSADIAVDHAAVRAAFHGRDPYGNTAATIRREIPEGPGIAQNYRDYPNWHPPARLALHAPLAFLPLRWAAIIWILLESAALVVALLLLGNELNWPSDLTLAGAGLGLILPLVQSELRGGQVHLVLLLLAVLAWRAARRARDTAAGAWIGLAVAIKVFPGVLLAPFLLQRRYRLIGTGAAVALGVTALAWIPFGSPRFFSATFGGGLSRWYAWPWNISWLGFSARAGIPVAVGLVGSGCFLLAALHPPCRVTGDRYWAAAPLMLLGLPISWGTYGLVALPWFLLGLAKASGLPRVVFAMATAVLLIDVPTTLSATGAGAAVTTIALVGAVCCEVIGRADDRERSGSDDVRLRSRGRTPPDRGAVLFAMGHWWAGPFLWHRSPEVVRG
jgi:hypothetical protein